MIGKAGNCGRETLSGETYVWRRHFAEMEMRSPV
jgi:hypothetical protein